MMLWVLALALPGLRGERERASVCVCGEPTTAHRLLVCGGAGLVLLLPSSNKRTQVIRRNDDAILVLNRHDAGTRHDGLLGVLDGAAVLEVGVVVGAVDVVSGLLRIALVRVVARWAGYSLHGPRREGGGSWWEGFGVGRGWGEAMARGREELGGRGMELGAVVMAVVMKLQLGRARLPSGRAVTPKLLRLSRLARQSRRFNACRGLYQIQK